MLQQKAALVEVLEDRLLEAREHRAVSAAERSMADEEEEEGPASAAVSAAMGVLGRGGTPIGTPQTSILQNFALYLIGSGIFRRC